jgi:hypothetical protein
MRKVLLVSVASWALVLGGVSSASAEPQIQPPDNYCRNVNVGLIAVGVDALSQKSRSGQAQQRAHDDVLSGEQGRQDDLQRACEDGDDGGVVNE